MFQIAAVPFDDFDALDVPDGPRWLLVRLARYADREGRCFPSMRTLAASAQEVAGDGLPLAEAALRSGVFHADPGSRPRLPLHAGRTLPAALAGAAQAGGGQGVSPPQEGVSQRARQEADPTKDEESARAEMKWRARLRQFFEEQRWVASYGPPPGDSACKAPSHLLVQWPSQRCRLAGAE